MTAEAVLASVRQNLQQGHHSDAARECLAFLKQDPANIEANMLYGEIAMALNRTDDAILIYRKLLAVDPNNAEAHDRLAYLYRAATDHINARKHAVAALRLDNSLLHSQLVLGAVAALEGKHEESLRLFELIRRNAPHQLEVERAYVDALLQCGEFDQARRHLVALLEQFPHDPYLYLALTRTGKLEADSPEADKVCSRADASGELVQDYDNPEDRVRACMALYRVYSNLGQHQAAFPWLVRAKTIRREEQPYDHASVMDNNARVRSVFNKAFFDRHGDRGYPDPAPIFILGMPRSGSTLLERVLGGHPDISNGGELPLASRLQLEACAHFGRNQHDLESLARVDDEGWTRIGEDYVRRAREWVGASRFFTDKMPGNFLCLGFIRAMLPQAKIIHLSRHPVANCLSVYEADFTLGHAYANDLSWLGAYYVEYVNTMAYWRELFGDQLIEVQYEDLVADTDNTVRRLGQQLGIELAVDDIRASQQQGAIKTASMWQARQPIHTESIARWQRLRGELQPLLEALAPVWRED